MLLLLAMPFLALAQNPNASNKDRSPGERWRKELGLSDEQVAKWNALNEETKTEVKEMRADTSMAKTDRRTQAAALKQSREESLKAILTPEQYQRYTEIRAERYDRQQAKKAGKKAGKKTNPGTETNPGPSTNPDTGGGN